MGREKSCGSRSLQTVQLSYGSGLPEPHIFDYETGIKLTSELNNIVICTGEFSLAVTWFARVLKLLSFQWAATGHFGRDLFNWEQPKKLIVLSLLVQYLMSILLMIKTRTKMLCRFCRGI